jgi:hypothetical protein
MNRATIGVLCAVAFLLSLIKASRTRRALDTMALEQVEYVFNLVENVLHPA